MPWRNLVRWVALVCGLTVLSWRTPEAIQDYREWREAAVNDPSVAELYVTNLWFETAGIVIALSLGLGIFFSLKRE